MKIQGKGLDAAKGTPWSSVWWFRERDWRGVGSAGGQAGDEAQVTFIDGALSNGTWHSEHLFLCSPRCQN